MLKMKILKDGFQRAIYPTGAIHSIRSWLVTQLQQVESDYLLPLVSMAIYEQPFLGDTI